MQSHNEKLYYELAKHCMLNDTVNMLFNYGKNIEVETIKFMEELNEIKHPRKPCELRDDEECNGPCEVFYRGVCTS